MTSNKLYHRIANTWIQAAQLSKVLRKELDVTSRTIGNVDALISKLERISKTLNEQDSTRYEIDRIIEDLTHASKIIDIAIKNTRKIQL